MTIYRYPKDLGSSSKRYPYIQLKAVKYNERSFVAIQNFLEQTRENGQGLDGLQVNTEKPVKTVEDSFYLPIPSDVTNNYNINWEMADLRLFQAGVNFLGTLDVKQLGSDLSSIYFDRLAKVFTRQTPNPKKQALFNGIEPRTFSFTFEFMPHSLKDAETIEKIVENLTNYALPSLETSNSSFYQFPHEFEIAFFNVIGTPKISPCVCTGITINTPLSTGLLSSDHVTETKLTMTFLETELLRKQKPGI